MISIDEHVALIRSLVTGMMLDPSSNRAWCKASGMEESRAAGVLEAVIALLDEFDRCRAIATVATDMATEIARLKSRANQAMTELEFGSIATAMEILEDD